MSSLLFNIGKILFFFPIIIILQQFSFLGSFWDDRYPPTQVPLLKYIFPTSHTKKTDYWKNDCQKGSTILIKIVWNSFSKQHSFECTKICFNWKCLAFPKSDYQNGTVSWKKMQHFMRIFVAPLSLLQVASWIWESQNAFSIRASLELELSEHH